MNDLNENFYKSLCRTCVSDIRSRNTKGSVRFGSVRPVRVRFGQLAAAVRFGSVRVRFGSVRPVRRFGRTWPVACSLT